MTVLDICAAPGAKTSHLAQLMHNNGTIYSVDYSRRRMQVWRNNMVKMGVRIAEPVIADARLDIPVKAQADVLVLDPPSTGTGTFRKSPSAKWRLSRNSVERMASIQWQMIDKSASLVKCKGFLIYSTNSITVEENEMIIERFLKNHLDFSLVRIKPEIGSPGMRGLEKCRRFYPHVHDCNGFFIAKLLREDI